MGRRLGRGIPQIPVHHIGVSKISKLVDNWISIDATKWGNLSGATIVSSQLQLPASVAYDAQIWALKPCDLTNSAMFCQLIQNINYSTGVGQLVIAVTSVSKDLNNSFGFNINGLVIEPFYEVGGVYNSLGDTTYNATTHKWLQIRATSDTIYFEVSVDSFSWTTLASVAIASTCGASHVWPWLYTGLASADIGVGTAIIDNLNIPAIPGDLTIAGVGLVAASAGLASKGDSAPMGVGNLSMAALLALNGDTNPVGVGAVSAAAIKNSPGDCVSAGIGVVAPAATKNAPGNCAVAGTGTVGCSGIETEIGNCTRTGVGSVVCTGQITTAGVTTIAGVGTVTPDGTLKLPPSRVGWFVK